MEYVRFLHPKHFDPQQSRFKSLAFRNSSNGGGCSIVQLACIDASGESICSHARTYYSSDIRGEPPIFWILEEDILPSGYRLEQTTSRSGDICHYDLHDVDNSALKALLRAKRLDDFLICDNGNHRPLRREDLPVR